MTKDPIGALETLVTLDIDRVVSSGQQESAVAGLDCLKQLVAQARDRIIIMPAGNIHERNVEKIQRETGARELHVTGFKNINSAMKFRNPRVTMGGTLRPPEYDREVTDAVTIETLVRLSDGSE